MLLAAWENEQALIEKKEKEVSSVNRAWEESSKFQLGSPAQATPASWMKVGESMC